MPYSFSSMSLKDCKKISVFRRYKWAQGKQFHQNMYKKMFFKKTIVLFLVKRSSKFRFN